MRKNDVAGEPAKKPFSVGRVLWAFAWKAVLAFLVVYGALQVLVRTDFFRSQVEAELSRLAGMEIRVGRIRATESLNVRLRDTIGVSKVAGIEARTSRIRWRLFRPRGEPMLESVRVDGLALTLAPDGDGTLQPAFLGRLTKKMLEWTGAPLPKGLEKADNGQALAPSALPSEGPFALEEWIRGPLIFQNVSVRWQDEEGNLLASVSGMDLTWMSEITPNGGRITHVECRAASIQVVDGPKISGFHVELVEAGGKQFLVNLDAADWGGMPSPRKAEAETRKLLDAMDEPVPEPVSEIPAF